MKFDRSNQKLYASKFTTAKIEWTFAMDKETPFGGNIYFAGDGSEMFNIG